MYLFSIDYEGQEACCEEESLSTKAVKSEGDVKYLLHLESL